MFSETPGMPGRSAHTPRTMRSIFTPAREARYSASITCGSTSAFIFAMMRAGRPARACSRLALDLRDDRFVQAERRLQQAAQLRRLREARELQEQLVHVLADLVVAGEKAVVRVGARGARVVVAGAEVAVAANATGLAPDDQHQLGVRLVADHAVHDVRAGFLQAVRQLDVRFFVEARAQLDDDRHVLARMRGGDQRVDDR